MDTVYNTFTDKMGRTIVVGMDMSNIVAEHDGECVATWMFDQRDEDGKDFLGVADMDKEYERAGIGREMFIAAEEYYEDFLLVNHFTEEGAKFFNGCKGKYNHDTFENDLY